MKIYATTFTLLRHFAIHIKKNEYSIDDLLFNMTSEQPQQYIDKLVSKGIVDGSMKDHIFEYKKQLKLTAHS